MSFVQRVNQGESLVNWLNWRTEPFAVCWSVIMGDLSPSPKGDFWTRPEDFRTGPPSCPVQGMSALTEIIPYFVKEISETIIW